MRICLYPYRELIMEAFDQLKRIVSEMDEDVAKAEGGNKAAGVRVRSAMQEVKNIAQQIRKEILEFRTDN